MAASQSASPPDPARTTSSEAAQARFQGVQRVRLWDDYGPVGEGASLARYVRAENGSEYIIKGPTLNPDIPYVAANELIAAQLASAIALPILAFRLVEDDDTLYFGSAWMEKNKTFYPGIDATLFARAANGDRVYDLVAFDYWIYNTDRNAQNLILRREAAGRSSAELLLLNDHSHSLIQPGTSPARMHEYVEQIPPVSLDFIRSALVSTADLTAAVALIEGVPDGTIDGIVDTVPELFLVNHERQPVKDFLVARRERLRNFFTDSLNLFPALKGKRL